MRIYILLLLVCLLFTACETSHKGNSKLKQSNLPPILNDIAPKKTGDRADTPFDKPSVVEADITTLLRQQAAAWNAGSIEKFMDFFWNSPYLRFASGDTVARGWAQIFTRYKKRYPTRDIMGSLEFKAIEVEQISKNSAIVHGQWELERANGTPWGLFTLVVRKFDNSWKITSDTITYGGQE